VKLCAKRVFRDDVYDLSGGHLPETFTLGEEEGKWVVYYSERGLETGKKEFASETEASKYFFDELRKDPAAHVGGQTGADGSRITPRT
jgi:hypothetical protein